MTIIGVESIIKRLESHRWCRDNGWVARALAWDDEQDRIIRETLTKGATAMCKNHIDIATAMLVKALKALEEVPMDKMSPRDIATMVDVASKLERISRGEVTERRESKAEFAGELKMTNLDLSNLSEGELNQLDEIINRIHPA